MIYHLQSWSSNDHALLQIRGIKFESFAKFIFDWKTFIFFYIVIM